MEFRILGPGSETQGPPMLDGREVEGIRGLGFVRGAPAVQVNTFSASNAAHVQLAIH